LQLLPKGGPLPLASCEICADFSFHRMRQTGMFGVLDFSRWQTIRLGAFFTVLPP
jgi:hypothetical protein